GAASNPENDCRITARSEVSDDGGLEVIGRGEMGGDDFLLLVGPPLIIRLKQRARAVVKFERRIAERTDDAARAQRRPNSADDDLFCRAPVDNEAADHDVISRAHLAASGDLQ